MAEKIIYVDKLTGSDSNDGLTVSTPKATHTGALAICDASPTVNKIYVGKGFYAENLSTNKIVEFYADDGTLFGNNKTQEINFNAGTAIGQYSFIHQNTVSRYDNNRLLYDDVNGIYYAISGCTNIALGSYNPTVYKSTDGIFWYNLLTPILACDSYGQANGSVFENGCDAILDTSKNLYLVVSAKNASKTANFQINIIKYTQSTGAWGSWNAITDIAKDQYRPAIEIDSNGYLHCVWVGKDNTYTTYNQIQYSKSTDGGATWSTMKVIDSTANNSYDNGNGAKIVIGTNNKLHVFWTGKDATYTNGTVKYAYSTDSGSTWSNAAVLMNSPSNSYWAQIPDAIANGDNIYVVYKSKDAVYTANSNVKIQKSTDNGATWSDWVNISPSASDRYNPQIMKDINGYLWVIYYASTSFYWSKSTDDGTTWDAWTSAGSNTNNTSYTPYLCKTQKNFTNPLVLSYVNSRLRLCGKWTTNTMNNVYFYSTNTSSTTDILGAFNDYKMNIENRLTYGATGDATFNSCDINLGGAIMASALAPVNYTTLGELTYSFINCNLQQNGAYISNNTNANGANFKYYLENSTMICSPLQYYENCNYAFKYKFHAVNTTIKCLGSATYNGLFVIGNGSSNNNININRETHFLTLDTCTLDIMGNRNFNIGVAGTSPIYNNIYTNFFHKTLIKDCTFKLNGVNLSQQYIDNYAILSCNASCVADINYYCDFTNSDNLTINEWYDLCNDARCFVSNINGDNKTHLYYPTGMHIMDNNTTFDNKPQYKLYHSIGTHDINVAPQLIKCTNGSTYTLAFNFNHHVNANDTYYIKLHVWRGQDKFSNKLATVSYLYGSKTIDTDYIATLNFTANSDENYYYGIEVSRQYDATHNYTLITLPTITKL